MPSGRPFRRIVLKAIDNLNQHRQEEGKSLQIDLTLRITNILKQQGEVNKLEPARKTRIKEGLVKILEENLGKENYDSNRLEQEIIYYIEKIDLSEEQVRLKNHCDYFMSIISEPEDGKGKKIILHPAGNRKGDQYHRGQGLRFKYPEMRCADEG